MSLPKSNHCKDDGEDAKDDVGSYFGVVCGSCRRCQGCRAGRSGWLFSLAEDGRHDSFQCRRGQLCVVKVDIFTMGRYVSLYVARFGEAECSMRISRGIRWMLDARLPSSVNRLQARPSNRNQDSVVVVG